jgi:hypothetical protein
MPPEFSSPETAGDPQPIPGCEKFLAIINLTNPCPFATVPFMIEPEAKQVLRSTLEMLKQQAIYTHRLHGWLIAVAETIAKQPDLAPRLKQHPLYDQGPAPYIQTIDTTTQNIDALIQRLKD